MGEGEEEPIELLIGDKEITEGEQEASVIKFVNQVIWEAYKDRATDIHLEPQEDELRIRYRIDEHSAPDPDAAAAQTVSGGDYFAHQSQMSAMNIARESGCRRTGASTFASRARSSTSASRGADGLRGERVAATAFARQRFF